MNNFALSVSRRINFVSYQEKLIFIEDKRSDKLELLCRSRLVTNLLMK